MVTIQKGARVRILKGEHKGRVGTAISTPNRATGYRLLVKIDDERMVLSYDARNLEPTEGQCRGEAN
jgi:ribosomal protein L24